MSQDYTERELHRFIMGEIRTDGWKSEWRKDLERGRGTEDPRKQGGRVNVEERMMEGIRAFHLNPVMIDDDPSCVVKRKVADTRTAHIHSIVEAVATRFGIDVEEVLSESAERRPVAARQAVVHVLRDRLGYSFPAIGKILHRHHTTIQHSYKSNMPDEVRQVVREATKELA